MKVKRFMFIGLFICTLINPAAAFASTDSAYPNQNSSSSTFNQFLFFILGDKTSSKKEWEHDGNNKEWDYDFNKKKCADQESNDIWRRFYHDWGKNRDKDWGDCEWGNDWHDDKDCDENHGWGHHVDDKDHDQWNHGDGNDKDKDDDWWDNEDKDKDKDKDYDWAYNREKDNFWWK